jgi:hypothetical protein
LEYAKLVGHGIFAESGVIRPSFIFIEEGNPLHPTVIRAIPNSFRPGDEGGRGRRVWKSAEMIERGVASQHRSIMFHRVVATCVERRRPVHAEPNSRPNALISLATLP